MRTGRMLGWVLNKDDVIIGALFRHTDYMFPTIPSHVYLGFDDLVGKRVVWASMYETIFINKGKSQSSVA